MMQALSCDATFQMREKARAARNIVLRVKLKPLWQVINVINAAKGKYHKM